MWRREESKKTWPGQLFIHSKPQSQSASWLGFFNSTQSYMTYKGCLCRVITTVAISPQKFRFPQSPSCPVPFSHVKNDKSLDGVLIQQLFSHHGLLLFMQLEQHSLVLPFWKRLSQRGQMAVALATWALCVSLLWTSELILHIPVLYTYLFLVLGDCL